MQKLQVKFELINDAEKKIHGYLPEKSTPLATGYDVRNAGENLVVKPFDYIKVPLGFKALIPEGYWFYLVGRSSTFAKKHFHYLNGIIDEDFEHQWYFVGQYIPRNEMNTEPYLGIAHGDRIAQIILLPRYDFDVVAVNSVEFSEESKQRALFRSTQRGEGFGTSGDK